MRREERDLCRDDLAYFVKRAWSLVETEPFVSNWHIRLVCKYLEALTCGDIDRCVINIPPGSSKSLLTGVFWPAWEWLKNPSQRWFNSSADPTLVNRDARKLQDLCRSAWYVELGGRTLINAREPVSNFTTFQGGRRFSTSFGGKAIGWHAHRFVYDDPIKPKDVKSRSPELLEKAWDTIQNVYGSRKLDPSSDLICMQRLSDEDPSGKALAMGGWVHLCLPMRCEFEAKHRANPLVPGDFDDPRVDGETLDKRRFTDEFLSNLLLTPDEWETQYQQHTGLKGGQIIEADWLKDELCVSPDELKSIVGLRNASWDLAFKDAESSDMVAGQWWLRADVNRRPHFFLCAEPFNDRQSFTQTIATIRRHRDIWPSTTILIEDKANGPAAENVLKSEIPNIALVNPLGSKVGRLQACSAAFADGRVHLLKGPSLERLRKTFTKFPRVRFDDEVDACTQALLAMGARAPFAQAMDRAKADLGLRRSS